MNPAPMALPLISYLLYIFQRKFRQESGGQPCDLLINPILDKYKKSNPRKAPNKRNKEYSSPAPKIHIPWSFSPQLPTAAVSGKTH